MIINKSYATKDYALVIELENGVTMEFRHEWEIREAMNRRKETQEFREMLKVVYAKENYFINSKTEIITSSKEVNVGAVVK